MIATATINGLLIEISGTDEECFQFLGNLVALPRFNHYEFPKKKVCDPMARHYGNCGAADCPIIAPHESLAAYQYRTSK